MNLLIHVVFIFFVSTYAAAGTSDFIRNIPHPGCDVLSSIIDIEEVRKFTDDVVRSLDGQSLQPGQKRFHEPRLMVEYFTQKYSDRHEIKTIVDLIQSKAKEIYGETIKGLSLGALPPLDVTPPAVVWEEIFFILTKLDGPNMMGLVGLIQLEMHATQGSFFDALFAIETQEWRRGFEKWMYGRVVFAATESAVTVLQNLKLQRPHPIKLSGDLFRPRQSEFSRTLDQVNLGKIASKSVLGPHSNDYFIVMKYFADVARGNAPVCKEIVLRATQDYQLIGTDFKERGIKVSDLPNPDSSVDAFWSDAFQEAGKHGRPMLVALLKAVPKPDDTPPQIKESFLRLLDEMMRP